MPHQPRRLAEYLAPLTRFLRAEVEAALSDPTSAAALLAGEWRQYFFPEADDGQFADAYAQTVAYALLLARLSGADDLDPAAAAATLGSEQRCAGSRPGAARAKTLGADYVQTGYLALDNADDYTPRQVHPAVPGGDDRLVLRWGFGWGDDAIDPKTRSLMNLAMIGALGKMTEWETHCRGALGNGVTKEQILYNDYVYFWRWALCVWRPAMSSASIAACPRRWNASASPARCWRNGGSCRGGLRYAPDQVRGYSG